MIAEDFEYEGESESGDEAREAEAEALDESDVEAEAEDVGADVGEDEALDEADLEASDVEALDESDAEVDEGLDEGLDEATVSASAQLRADQDRNRRAEWGRRIAADQRLEAQRAASTQRSLTSQIQSIQPGGAARVYSTGPLQGAGVVTAILPNGRRSRMRIIPTLAPVSEVNRLRQVIAVNDRRQAVATVKNSRAITALARTQTGAIRKLTADGVKSDKDLRRRIVEGDNRLDKRITKELSGGTGSLDKHGRRMMRMLRRQRQRSIMNSVLLATSAPFFSAYGTRGKPFAKNNMILTGSLLGWLLGDELIDQSSGKSNAMRGAANVWSYFAPVGNGLTDFLVFRNKQHVRFVNGINVLPAAGTDTFDITPKLAKSAVADFKNTKHTVVASIVSGAPAGSTVLASVDNNGALTLSVLPVAAATVAWVVDTQATA
jgi:hypothetical protein